MSNTDSELTLEEQVEKIRKRRQKHGNHAKVQRFLNTAFLVLAAIGLVWYYTTEENTLIALGVIAIGMLFKVVELFLRFVF